MFLRSLFTDLLPYILLSTGQGKSERQGCLSNADCEGGKNRVCDLRDLIRQVPRIYGHPRWRNVPRNVPRNDVPEEMPEGRCVQCVTDSDCNTGKNCFQNKCEPQLPEGDAARARNLIYGAGYYYRPNVYGGYGYGGYGGYYQGYGPYGYNG